MRVLIWGCACATCMLRAGMRCATMLVPLTTAGSVGAVALLYF
jgi:hypothetical protein